jgi:hypothetical protein
MTHKPILSLAVAGAILASIVLAARPVHATAPAASSSAPVDFTVTSKAPGRMVHMMPVNDTKTHGVAVFVYDPIAKKTLVTVVALGFPTGGKFFPNIQTGVCGANGSMVAELPTIQASQYLTGSSAGVVNGTWQAKSWHISLYRKAGALGFQRWAIACANV